MPTAHPATTGKCVGGRPTCRHRFIITTAARRGRAWSPPSPLSPPPRLATSPPAPATVAQGYGPTRPATPGAPAAHRCTPAPAMGCPFRGNRSCHASGVTPLRVSRWLHASAPHPRVAQGGIWGSRLTARRQWPPHPPALSRPAIQTTHGQLGARFPWVRRPHSFTLPPLPHPLSCTHRPPVRAPPPAPSRHPDGCDFDSGRGGGNGGGRRAWAPYPRSRRELLPTPSPTPPSGGGGA